MKKLFLLGTFALLTTTLFSCTADELGIEGKKTEIKKPIITADGTAQGPDDDPVPVTPPKK
jgi:predicted aspartyl protease